MYGEDASFCLLAAVLGSRPMVSAACWRPAASSREPTHDIGLIGGQRRPQVPGEAGRPRAPDRKPELSSASGRRPWPSGPVRARQRCGSGGLALACSVAGALVAVRAEVLVAPARGGMSVPYDAGAVGCAAVVAVAG